MKTVTIHDAKTNLSKYIAAAKRGEKIYIGSFGEAEVVLSKLTKEGRSNLTKRSFNIAKGMIKATPDAFSEQTDEKVSKLMFGN